MAHNWEKESRERKRRAPQVFVSDASVHEDGYTIYKIICKVLDESRPNQSFDYYKETVTWKRFSDIKALHNLLITLHKKLFLKGIVPSFAKAKVFGRFDAQVIEERRISAQNLFDFVALHPPLYRSNFFHNFFKNSKVVKRSEELAKLKEKPLHPIKATTGENDVTTEDLCIETNKSSLSEADLETFDPFYTKEFISSTSVNQDNDWLKEIKREFTPTDDLAVNPVETEIKNIQDNAQDNELLTQLQTSATDKEMAEFYEKKKNGTVRAGADDAKFLVKNSENLNRFSEVREQHRKSSKASAYLNQVLKNVSSEGTDDNNSSTLENIDTKAVSVRGEEQFLSANVAANKDSLLSASGSLADLWKFLKDDDEEDKRGAYIMQANQQISYARKAELREAYEESFGHYKTAINTLLMGVQDDVDEQRIQAVRRKTAIYLKRAEDIYNDHLEGKSEAQIIWEPAESPPTQPEFKSASPKPLPYAFSGARKRRGTSSPIPHIPSPRHTSADLSCYKVIGTVGNVLLVVENSTSQTFAMKVIAKSCKNRQSKGVIPTNVPFMVRLHRYYSTDNSICLLLEYAQGGKLWDQLSSYFKCHTVQHKKGIGSMKRSRTFTSDNHENSKKEMKKLADGNLSDAETPENNKVCAKSNRIKRTESLLSWDSPQLDIAESPSEKDVTETEEYSYKLSEINYTEIASAANHTLFTVGDDNFEEKSDDESFCSDFSESDLPQDLLSEQDMSAVYICNSDEKSIPQNERSATLSSSPRNLSSGPASPCLSVNSSFEATNDQDTNSVSIPTTMVSRMVDENGVSSVDAISLFRTHSRTKSVELNVTHNEGSTTLPHHNEGGGGENAVFETSVNSIKQVHSIFEEMDDASAKSAVFHLPEETVKLWTAEMVIAVGTLHSVGILCRDLNPDNILLSNDGHIRLSYFGKWRQVERQRHCEKALNEMYAAPESHCVTDKKTEACDWWSIGTIIYEIMTGQSLQRAYPSGMNSHTVLDLPEHLSAEAKSFLKGLLQHNPRERLGYGLKNLDDIMEHPFFNGIEWDSLIELHSGS